MSIVPGASGSRLKTLKRASGLTVSLVDRTVLPSSMSAMLTQGKSPVFQNESSFRGGVRPAEKSTMWPKHTHSQAAGNSNGVSSRSTSSRSFGEGLEEPYAVADSPFVSARRFSNSEAGSSSGS